MKFPRWKRRSERPREEANNDKEDSPPIVSTSSESPDSSLDHTVRMRLPRQTRQCRDSLQDDYLEENELSTPPKTPESPSRAAGPQPLEKKYTMLLRSSLSIRIEKGKWRAGTRPPFLSDSDERGNNGKKAKPQGRRKHSCMPAKRADGFCDDCGIVASAAGTSPGALTIKSDWDLDEVAWVDLPAAIMVKGHQIEQDHVIPLAIIRLKYERRRRRMPRPKWLRETLLGAAERREYNRKVRELDQQRERELMEYEEQVKRRIDERNGVGRERYSEPYGRPQRSLSDRWFWRNKRYGRASI